MYETDRLFSQNIVLPSQFLSKRTQESPERTLWAAVLTQALEDLHSDMGLHGNQTGKSARARLRARLRTRAEVRSWVTARCTSVGSFSWVCEVLHLDAALLRAALAEPAGVGSQS